MMRCPYAQNRWCVHADNQENHGGHKVACRFKDIRKCPYIQNHKDGKFIIKMLLGPLRTRKNAKVAGVSDA